MLPQLGMLLLAATVHDAIDVSRDGAVELTRTVRGLDPAVLCARMRSAYASCETTGDATLLAVSFDTVPWVKRRGREFTFDVGAFVEAMPLPRGAAPNQQTVTLAMPGELVHRFGCLVPPETEAEITFSPQDAPWRPCERMPPVQDGVLRYEGGLEHEYRERPRQLITSFDSERGRWWIVLFLFGVMVFLIPVARLADLSRIAGAFRRR